jgi:hypothetical protein
VLITRTPDGRLTFPQAMASRRKAALAAGLPAAFTGYLITDGYAGYQHLLPSRLAGIQQCAAHYPDTAVMPMTDADPCCEGEFLITVSA